jgi:dihydrofolate synthase/folylpolyglutamate synthase
LVKIFFNEPDFHKKLDASQLADIAEEHRSLMKSEVQVVTIPDWKEALEQLKQITEPDDLAVVTGTLYLISDVRSWILSGDKSDKGW